MEKFRRYLYAFIHLNFVSGFLYAFYHFINTPRSVFIHRRLWAYESWIILSFYFLFIYLILVEKGLPIKITARNARKRIENFRQILLVNLILLVFPWGLFLILAPKYLLNLNPNFWRVLGFFSLLGGIIYYLPYHFYRKRITFPILVFGAIDNLLAGLIILLAFFLKEIPLVVFSTTPLLFYFSFFFFNQTKIYRRLIKHAKE
jgi:hypothetical protein